MGKIAQELLAEVNDFLTGFADARVAAFLAGVDWQMPQRELAAAALPCLRHLDRCWAEAENTTGEPVARLLAERGARLHWGQTYTAGDIGEVFLQNYCWLELFGTRGHFVNDRIACGFLVLGPRTQYPDHHHEAEEIYIPLNGGALWKKGEGAFEPRGAGEAIHHPSNVNHAMKTGEAPLLALYLWRGGPLAAKSTLTGKADA